MRRSWFWLVLLGGCSAVHHYEVRPDYQEADRTQTIRLTVICAPLPDGTQAVGDMWSEIAQRYANDHRDFIVKTARAAPAEPADLCVDGIDGVLHLTPSVQREDAKVKASVVAKLTRCRDGAVVWSADAGGTWASDDKGLVDVTQHYTEKYGEAVKPYVAPSFRLLKETLAVLPLPSIQGNEKAVEEKIEQGD